MISVFFVSYSLNCSYIPAMTGHQRQQALFKHKKFDVEIFAIYRTVISFQTY